jgi:hypothetical protein
VQEPTALRPAGDWPSGAEGSSSEATRVSSAVLSSKGQWGATAVICPYSVAQCHRSASGDAGDSHCTCFRHKSHLAYFVQTRGNF